MRTLLKMFCAVSLLAAAGVVLADDAAPQPTKQEPAAREMSELERDNVLLLKENQALRRQVVALRKCLGENVTANKTGASSVGPESAGKDDAVATADSAQREVSRPDRDRPIGLEAENERIRKENQTLRRQVVALRSRIGNSVAEDVVSRTDVTGAEVDEALRGVDPGQELDERWLSGSKRRHNSSCRYFKVGSGCLCTPTDGTPCRVCGG